MGDCYSRPTDCEIQRHREQHNSQNDANFIENLTLYKKHELLSMSQFELSQILSKLEAEKSNLYSKLDLTTAGQDLIPNISIEIQKGLDLCKPGCISDEKPFIRVSLEPGGPSFETARSDKYLPEWYKLIQISQSLLGFTILRVSIMLDNKKPIFFGKFDLSLPELESQKLFNNWVKINSVYTHPALKPRLKVRVQLIYDIRALYTVFIKELNEKIEETEQIIKKQA